MLWRHTPYDWTLQGSQTHGDAWEQRLLECSQPTSQRLMASCADYQSLTHGSFHIQEHRPFLQIRVGQRSGATTRTSAIRTGLGLRTSIPALRLLTSLPLCRAVIQRK